jgi:hypothetical protein
MNLVKNPTNTFWSTANRAFTKKERKAFNEWRLGLYLAADRLRDDVMMSEKSQKQTDMKNLMNIVCFIPSLEEK